MPGGMRAGAAGATRIAVNVTFLRMDARPDTPAPALPQGATVETLGAPTVGFYRYLYATVGGPYCWWLRRVAPDAEIEALLASPAISIHVLYRDGEPAGFYELDARSGHDVNLAYFGLMPHLIGKGAGEAFLRHAIDCRLDAVAHTAAREHLFGRSSACAARLSAGGLQAAAHGARGVGHPGCAGDADPGGAPALAGQGLCP